MPTEMGEYVVGAYLKLRLKCDFVDYNVRPPEGGLAGLAEIDVVGVNLSKHKAYLCEVTTHLDGLLYGSSYGISAKKIKEKYDRLRVFGEKYLHEFKPISYMFWSPRVPRGKLLEMLKEIEKQGFELILNKEYKERVNELRDDARKTTRDIGNPFFRSMQILERLHD